MLVRFRDLTLLVLAAMAAFSMVLATDTALSVDWNSYSPAHAVGSGDDDWWTTYPDQHENSGKAVEHPDWIVKALKEKPVLILIHSSNCVPCLTQTPRIKAAVESNSGDLAYFDMLAEGSGLPEAIDILDVYNPPEADGKQLVPTTIFITLAKGQDGKVGAVWHSEIDAMSEGRIDDYVLDAIYYYKQNSAAWI